VEVDPNWETAVNDPQPAAAPQPTSHIGYWLKLIPWWGWVIIASVFAVIVESVAVRLSTPADSSLRTAWSLTQLAVGFATVIGCHIFNFLELAAEDADVGLLDTLLKPLKLWARTCGNLPKRLRLVNALACGAAAVLASLLIIGGIPYERLWDWGVKQPPKQTLMGAVMDRAKEIQSRNESLEEAVGDFAGKAGVDDEEKKKEEPKPRQHADCVVLGYQLDHDGRLATLMLGTAYRGQLVFAGRVEPKLSESEIRDLLAALKALATKTPFISIQAEQIFWVQPRISCRVTHEEQLRNGVLRNPQWDTLLGLMRTPTAAR
jgi:hypothetical protein